MGMPCVWLSGIGLSYISAPSFCHFCEESRGPRTRETAVVERGVDPINDGEVGMVRPAKEGMQKSSRRCDYRGRPGVGGGGLWQWSGSTKSND